MAISVGPVPSLGLLTSAGPVPSLGLLTSGGPVPSRLLTAGGPVPSLGLLTSGGPVPSRLLTSRGPAPSLGSLTSRGSVRFLGLVISGGLLLPPCLKSPQPEQAHSHAESRCCLDALGLASRFCSAGHCLRAQATPLSLHLGLLCSPLKPCENSVSAAVPTSYSFASSSVGI